MIVAPALLERLPGGNDRETLRVITALVSKKGGVGKTTTCVNLAAALAGTGRRVLVVDLDSQASASLSLGVERGALAPSIADALLDGRPLPEVVRATDVPGLDLVTASVDLVSAESELGVFRTPHERLRKALLPVTPRYDAILLDCAPSVSLLPTLALVAADTFIVPVTPQYLAITGVESLLTYSERLYRHHRRPRLLGLVLTMVDYRTRATRDNVAALRREFGSRVFGIEIRVNVRLAEAPEHGRTIFEHSPDATGAHAYRLLAEEYLLRAGGLSRLARVG